MRPKRRRIEQEFSVDREQVRRAEEAASKAEEDLRAVERQRPEVDQLAASFRRHLKANHFGEKFKLEIRRRASSP
ncbi:hypothetical protein [Nocardia sp. NPDC019302]|uniref:DUF7620 family protein n=1 Tax=Nocardia sp. NPDC019302 TaxID=3154592 RepID=UPI003410AEF1